MAEERDRQTDIRQTQGHTSDRQKERGGGQTGLRYVRTAVSCDARRLSYHIAAAEEDHTGHNFHLPTQETYVTVNY